MENPYSAMLEALRPPAGDNSLVMGQVTATAPLRVLVGGNAMDADELLCNAALLGDGTVSAFSPGDQLLMYPIEEAQRYVIICKVVEL